MRATYRGLREIPRPPRRPRNDSALVRDDLLLGLVVVFGRNVVFRNLFGGDFRLIGIERVFHAADDSRLVILALVNQLFDAFGIGVFGARKSLRVSGLAAGAQ